MKNITVGIIGAGMISHGSHAGAFSREPGVTIAAVADIDADRARSYAEKHSIPKWFTSYDEMLRSVELDAVSVALPVFAHAPATLAGLAAGKHVLCEKPMARNLAEAESMVEAARRSGKKFQIYWRQRFSPQAQRARQLIAEGRLGSVYYARSAELRWRGRPGFDRRWPGYGKWFGHKDEAGGGTLMDIGGYSIDLVLGLLDFPEIESVSGTTFEGIDERRRVQEGWNVEDFAAAFIRFKSGAVFHLETAFASNIDEHEGTWLFGSGAGLKMRPLTLFRPDAEDNKVEEAIDVSGAAPTSPVHQFITAIRDDRPIEICNPEEALIIQRVQDAIYRSAEAGRSVTL
jgi:predicted dehydrogenase